MYTGHHVSVLQLAAVWKTEVVSLYIGTSLHTGINVSVLRVVAVRKTLDGYT